MTDQFVRLILITIRFLEKRSLPCIQERASARYRGRKWAKAAVQRARTKVPPFCPSCVKSLDEGQDIQRCLECGFRLHRQCVRQVDSQFFCPFCTLFRKKRGTVQRPYSQWALVLYEALSANIVGGLFSKELPLFIPSNHSELRLLPQCVC